LIDSRAVSEKMDFSNSQELTAADSAYSPQILNEVDTNMGGTEEPPGREPIGTNTGKEYPLMSP
jgi:hypothetical protein